MILLKLLLIFFCKWIIKSFLVTVLSVTFLKCCTVLFAIEQFSYFFCTHRAHRPIISSAKDTEQSRLFLFWLENLRNPSGKSQLKEREIKPNKVLSWSIAFILIDDCCRQDKDHYGGFRTSLCCMAKFLDFRFFNPRFHELAIRTCNFNRFLKIGTICCNAIILYTLWPVFVGILGILLQY